MCVVELLREVGPGDVTRSYKRVRCCTHDGHLCDKTTWREMDPRQATRIDVPPPLPSSSLLSRQASSAGTRRHRRPYRQRDDALFSVSFDLGSRRKSRRKPSSNPIRIVDPPNDDDDEDDDDYDDAVDDRGDRPPSPSPGPRPSRRDWAAYTPVSPGFPPPPPYPRRPTTTRERPIVIQVTPPSTPTPTSRPRPPPTQLPTPVTPRVIEVRPGRDRITNPSPTGVPDRRVVQRVHPDEAERERRRAMADQVWAGADRQRAETDRRWAEADRRDSWEADRRRRAQDVEAERAQQARERARQVQLAADGRPRPYPVVIHQDRDRDERPAVPSRYPPDDMATRGQRVLHQAVERRRRHDREGAVFAPDDARLRRRNTTGERVVWADERDGGRLAWP